MTKEELFSEINKVLLKDPASKLFILDYYEYVHKIDDLIDEGIKSNENLLSVFHAASKVFSNDFYRRYGHMLFIVNTLIHNTYSDIIQWEKSEIDWQKAYADNLRHCAIDMVFAVLYIVGGEEAMRKLSLPMREFCRLDNLNDIIQWSKS